MSLPLDIVGIGEWLAFVTLILLVTSEALADSGPGIGLLIDRSRLRLLAVTTGLIVLGIIVIEVLQQLTG